MRLALARIKKVAIVFVAATCAAAWVPVVAAVLTSVLVAAWVMIAAVVLSPAAKLAQPYLPVLIGHAQRGARVVGPWLSPRPVLVWLAARSAPGRRLARAWAAVTGSVPDSDPLALRRS